MPADHAVSSPVATFRSLVVRRAATPISLAVGGSLLFAAVLGSPVSAVEVLLALAVALAGNLARRREVPTPPGLLATCWLALAALTNGMLGFGSDVNGVVTLAMVAVVLTASLALDTFNQAAVTVLAASLTAIGWVVAGRPSNGWTMSAVLVLIAVVVRLASTAIQRIERGRTVLMTELSHERRAIESLYDVATSIGASTSLAETLPDLLGRVARSVGAGLCGVALVDEATDRLELASPVWVDGTCVALEPAAVLVGSQAPTVRVLRSTRGVHLRRAAGDALLRSLELDEAVAAPLRLEGRPIGLLIAGRLGEAVEPVVEEITALAGPASLVIAQVKRYQEAAELADRLTEIAEMKSDFVSMVSHELKTPLTSVVGALDTLVRPGLEHPTTAAQELIVAARRQALRLRRLIDDLLILSRIDRGGYAEEPGLVQLARAAHEAATVVGDARVSVNVPDSVAVLADPGHLSQIFVNLIENAVKYGAGPIEVDAQVESGRVAVSVSDHGAGIPVPERGRVFERFVRLSSDASVGGTGLGLAIVKMLAEKMDAGIEVVDTPGGGATFVLSMPAFAVSELEISLSR